MLIADSDFERNFADSAGGLGNSSGYLLIRGSRIAQNLSIHIAGGLGVGGGSVFVTETTFRGNDADGAGGLQVFSGATVVVTDSSFVENRSSTPTGGPAAILNRGFLSVENTTFAGNNAVFGRGSGAISNRGQLTLVNSTLVGTSPSSTFDTSNTLSTAPDATTILKNTIIVHDPAEPLIQDCAGPVTSRGNNLIGDLTGCTVTFQPGDLTGDAGLAAFTDDGTPGNGHFPLLKDSQAVDAGNDAFCPRRDQIGQLRKGQCDIGAIEFRMKKGGHHGWNDDDHDEGEDAWSREPFDEGFDQRNGNTRTPEDER